MFIKLFKQVPRLFQQRLVHKQIFNMENVYFRYIDASEHFQISFRYANEKYGVDREFNFSRQISENVEDCLHRMNVNVEKAFTKKIKRKKNSPENETAVPDIDVKIYRDGNVLPGDLVCKDLLENNDNLTLKILDKEYSIVFNAPNITLITLPSSILANFPVYPNKFELLFASKDQCTFTWYKGTVPLAPDSKNKGMVQTWTQIGSGFVVYPSNQDIGFKLKVVCEPVNNGLAGPSAEVVSASTVEAGPGYCPFDFRHNFTKEKLSSTKFRVCSYNILADLYCDSEHTRSVLYPYCPPYALNIDYRKQLFLKELLGYNFDIACLQEVDSRIFDQDLIPVFESVGFNGHYKKKGATVSEGLAVFYNNTRFKYLDKYGIILGEEISLLSIFNELWKKIENNAPLVARLVGRNTAVQALVLKPVDVENTILIVANTHLYFHPDSDHVRLLQAGFATLWVHDIVKKTKQQYPGDSVCLLFCGDFNSTPDCGIYRLMTTLQVPDDVVDWSSNLNEAVVGVSLSQSIEMGSACGTPQYTNYTSEFADCLDYIFYQKDLLEVDQVIPLPSNEELELHTALPSIVFPSDHIAIVADLNWK